MKQAQNARKQRGRPAQRKGGRSNSNGGGAGNRTENRVRGNPKQLLEKYKTQARDALQAGDRVTAEYFLQFADHYQRVVNEMQGHRDQQGGGDNKDDNHGRRGRGRRDHHNKPPADTETQATPEAKGAPKSDKQDSTSKEESKETAKATVKADASDIATSEQPVEVHPELDLDQQVVEEKPKRRAPVRRKRTPKPKVQEPEAASVDEKSVPEGGEAA